jgi:hypothetical protein
LLTSGSVTESAGGVDAGERTESKAAGEGEEEILEGVGNDELVLLDVASINDGEVIGGRVCSKSQCGYGVEVVDEE